MTDLVERLRKEVEQLRADMNGDAAEIIRLNREVERQRAVVEEWKERLRAEQADHEATIRHCDKVMNDDPA